MKNCSGVGTIVSQTCVRGCAELHAVALRCRARGFGASCHSAAHLGACRLKPQGIHLSQTSRSGANVWNEEQSVCIVLNARLLLAGCAVLRQPLVLAQSADISFFSLFSSPAWSRFVTGMNVNGQMWQPAGPYVTSLLALYALIIPSLGTNIDILGPNAQTLQTACLWLALSLSWQPPSNRERCSIAAHRRIYPHHPWWGARSQIHPGVCVSCLLC